MHCTNRPASLRLHHPYGNFRRGHPKYTTSCLSTSIGKLHKQRSATSGYISVFRSYCLSSSLCAIHTLSNSKLPVIHIGFIKRELRRGWKWYVGVGKGIQFLACTAATRCTCLLVLAWRKTRGNPRSPDMASAPRLHLLHLT